MKRMMLVAALGTIGWACAPAPSVTTDGEEASAPVVDEAAVRAELEGLRTQFLTFVRTGDMSLLQTMLAEGAMMIPPAGNGWSEMLAAAGETPFPIGSTIEMSPRELIVIDDEWAYEFGSSVFTWTPEGGEPEELRDTYLILFRNQGDGWKIWREVASANLPPDVM